MEPISSSHMENLRSVWFSESFSLGIPLIDLQHVWLVHILTSLEEQIVIADREAKDIDIQPHLEKVLNYVSEHFALEEDVLEHFSYPSYQEHLLGHRNFVEKILEKFHSVQDNQIAALGLLQILKVAFSSYSKR